MAESAEAKQSIVKVGDLPANYPTNLHSMEFWEALGRAVATFGFLEEVLAKAIFAFSGMREVPEEQAAAELEKWQAQLEKALKDSLGGLIGSYAQAVKAHGGATIANLDELIEDLRKASIIRNVICHGSWRSPDDQSRSLPFFIDRKLRVFDSQVDVAFLRQVQQHATELACAVISSVTHMGWQFPGSPSPGKPLW
jgi:hypothetical protein